MPSTNSSGSLWCLVDCNNFYASCEQLFRPDLRNRPVVVLSNNDGCIIARSREAKAIGVPMGEAWFKMRPLLEKSGAAVFSANFALYGDISNRIMSILEKLAPHCEQYSIDEAFLRIGNAQIASLPEFCRNLRDTVQRWTGITVSIGVGKTPTLAKLANKIAKKTPECGGVFSLFRPRQEIDRYLAATDVGDIWGIGKGHLKKLLAHGIHNALQFKEADDVWLRKALTVTGLRRALELRGILCETTWENPDWKRRTVLHSRSFGNRTHGLEELSQAIATFAARCAERLRAMGLVAGGVWARARTSAFDGAFHACSGSVTLPVPTSDSLILTTCARNIIARAYRPGAPYAKAAVMFFNLEQKNNRQLNLFEKPYGRSDSLMNAIDKINQRYGRLTLRLGAMGLNRADWHMRQERLSPGYTTEWAELPIASCGA